VGAESSSHTTSSRVFEAVTNPQKQKQKMGGGVMEKNTIATRIFQLLGGDLAPKNYIFFCLDMFGFVF